MDVELLVTFFFGVLANELEVLLSEVLQREACCYHVHCGLTLLLPRHLLDIWIEIFHLRLVAQKYLQLTIGHEPPELGFGFSIGPQVLEQEPLEVDVVPVVLVLFVEGTYWHFHFEAILIQKFSVPLLG